MWKGKIFRLGLKETYLHSLVLHKGYQNCTCNTDFHPDLGFCSLYSSHTHMLTHTCCLIWKCFKPKLVYYWWFEKDLGLGQHWCIGYSFLTFAHPLISLEQNSDLD